MNDTLRIGTPNDPAERLRQDWAVSLEEHMAAKRNPTTGQKGISRKELVALLSEVGCNVSRQAVEQWLSAKTSPRPHHQAALAAVFEVPVRRLFPIEAAAS